MNLPIPQRDILESRTFEHAGNRIIEIVANWGPDEKIIILSREPLDLMVSNGRPQGADSLNPIAYREVRGIIDKGKIVKAKRECLDELCKHYGWENPA